MRMLRHGMAVLAALLIGGCVSPTIDDEPAARLSYGDLDLADPADRQVFRERLHAAAQDFCERRAQRRQLPPHYARAHPEACLLPAQRALIDAAPPAVRRAWVSSRAITG